VPIHATRSYSQANEYLAVKEAAGKFHQTEEKSRENQAKPNPAFPLPATQHAVLYIDHHTAKVVPGVIVAVPGDTIEFEALNTDYELFIPEALEIFGDSRAVVAQIKENNTVSFTVGLDSKPGRYPYAGYSTNYRLFVVGNSDPTIIIRNR
jgi:hypothetical protein